MPLTHLLSLFAALTLPTPMLLDETWPQVPPEPICKLCFEQCESDLQRLTERLGGPLGAWNGLCLVEAKTEAERMKEVWWAAWYLASPPTYPYQKQEWAEELQKLVTEEQFWRGHLPLPLSLR